MLKLTFFLVFFWMCQIRGSQLWGTDLYTDDSDIVAGMIKSKTFHPLSQARGHCLLHVC